MTKFGETQTHTALPCIKEGIPTRQKKTTLQTVCIVILIINFVGDT